MWRERMRDAAVAASIPSSWAGAVAGYVAHGDPYRVWTAADWARFKGLRKLPIFVRSDPSGASQAEDDAFAALRDLHDLGVPHGCYVALDRETSKDAAYDAMWAAVIRWGGYRPVQYYSASSGTTAGFAWDWVASWRSVVPFMLARPARATEYQSGKLYDSSTVRWWTYMFGHWWR